jgi:catechol 2,3-dioxygenase-like lactoylglutathione lyase family enzyme
MCGLDGVDSALAEPAGSASGSSPASLPPHPHSGSQSSLPPVHHIGMVVRDLTRTLALLNNGLGFAPAFTFDGQFPTARLASGETGFALKGAFVWMHNTALEIIQPIDDRSPHAAFLKERGEGLHHLAYWVHSVKAQLEQMRHRGMSTRLLADATGPENPVPWCYVEGDALAGAIIELVERNPASAEYYAQVFRIIGGKPPG